MDKKVVLKETPLDFMWPTQEPFLFCVHHYDRYPAGNENNGVDSHHFTGRNMGSDFNPKDGFRLYHGEEIPGFPVHPHRGFETITIVRKGYVDHADSLGAAGRYGEGDVQWMTAGGGVQHSEMFPLLHKDKENTCELFQIWLNLPKKNKMVPADFKMMWANDIPVIKKEGYSLTLVSGEYEGKKYYPAPKNSWANDPDHKVNIYLIKMEKGATVEIPSLSGKTNRTLYFFEGGSLVVNGKDVSSRKSLNLDSSLALTLKHPGKSDDLIEILYLEALPIGEPVVQHGPFVMNTKEEIYQAINDYQKTQFGGWNWQRKDMIHGSKIERFARYPNGKIERPS